MEGGDGAVCESFAACNTNRIGKGGDSNSLSSCWKDGECWFKPFVGLRYANPPYGLRPIPALIGRAYPPLNA